MPKSKTEELEKLFGIASKQQLIEDLQEAEEAIKNGEGIDADIVFKELRSKYEHRH